MRSEEAEVLLLVNSGCYNKVPYTEWVKQQKLMSCSSGSYKSKINAPAWLGSGEDHLFQVAHCWLLAVSSHSRKRTVTHSPPLLIRALIPFVNAPL